MHSKDKIAIIGVGRWGKNLLKTFSVRAEISLICHTGDSATDEWLKSEYPHIPVTHNVDEVMENVDISAVCIATPIHTHSSLVRVALEHEKDVFVEKPLCQDPVEAVALTELAQQKNKNRNCTGTDTERPFYVGKIRILPRGRDLESRRA